MLLIYLVFTFDKCVNISIYVLNIYRLSQKKSPHVINVHNSLKNVTRNKSRMSF